MSFPGQKADVREHADNRREILAKGCRSHESPCHHSRLPATRYRMACESQRDSETKPRVGAQRLPWGHRAVRPNPNGVTSGHRSTRPQPRWGCHLLASVSQGSSCLATLGFETESLWDSAKQRTNLWVTHRSWSAVTSDAIHGFGASVSERSCSPSPRWFPIQSGDSEDFVAAVQNLAAFPTVYRNDGADGRVTVA